MSLRRKNEHWPFVEVQNGFLRVRKDRVDWILPILLNLEYWEATLFNQIRQYVNNVRNFLLHRSLKLLSQNIRVTCSLLKTEMRRTFSSQRIMNLKFSKRGNSWSQNIFKAEKASWSYWPGVSSWMHCSFSSTFHH